MSQFEGKWIENNAINDERFRLRNDQPMRGRNNANDGDVNIGKVTASDLWLFQVQPQFVGSPTTDDDLVNRGYVSSLLAGVRDPKDAVRAASTGNIDLATGGLLTIDGVALQAGDRVLVKDQTDPIENGIYEAAVGAWSRSSDADADDEVTQGMSTLVVEGTLNARKLYALSTADPIVVDTTALSFVHVPNPANFLVPKTIENAIDATDVANGYIDLAHEAEAESIVVHPVGGPKQRYNTDYTVSVVSNVTRITFAGNLASLLANGDTLMVSYSYAVS